MRLIPHKRWNVANEKADKIKELLLSKGGEEKEVSNIYEEWRMRISDATIVYYKKGTLYITDSNDPEIINIHTLIDSIVGSRFVPPTKEYLIGFDESGKGEVLGPMILAGVLIPSNIFKELEGDIGVADTKVRHNVSYWEKLFRKIDLYKDKGMRFIIQEIRPEEIDKYNINKLLDINYLKMLRDLIRDIPINRTRVVFDDYGIGSDLQIYLKSLEKEGIEVISDKKADDNYLEVKIASLIAKREREEIIEAIRRDPAFKINEIDIGSGNANDQNTIRWLKEWRRVKREWPPFVRCSYKTVRDIEEVFSKN